MRGFRGLSRSALAGVVIGVVVTIGAINLLGEPGALAAVDDAVVTGMGQGGPANVRTFSATGTDGGVSFSSEGGATSGVRVAAGDLDGDGTPELITGSGPGRTTKVQVWSKDGKALMADTEPFPGFGGGVFLATANVDETPQREILVSAGPGGGPHVKALRLVNGTLETAYSFMAYEAGFHGGVFVGGSGGRIITGPGEGGGPHVKVFRISQGVLSVDKEWMAYDPKFTGGVRVAAGALRDTVNVDIVTAAGPGGGPHVKLWSLEGSEGPGFMAYDVKFAGGVWVGVGQGHLITGAGAGGGPHVKVMTVNAADSTFPVTASFMAYAANFIGGVHVAGIPETTTPPTTTTACNGIPPLCLPGGGEETTTTTPASTTTTTSGGGSSTTTGTGPTTSSTTSTSTPGTTSSTTSTTLPDCGTTTSTPQTTIPCNGS